MKRRFLLKSLAFMAFLMCMITAGAYDFPDYEYQMYFNYLDDGSVEVTFYDENYNSYSGYVTIPSVATRGALNQTTFPVTRIGNYAFRECSDLTGVSIPTSITSIGSSAFCICNKLATVTIPYSVKTIGWNAFGDCDNLKSVYIGSGVTNIAAYGFDSPLTSVYCYATTPPTIANSNAFKSSTYNNATLYVPADSYYLYKNATYWSNFANITRLPSSSAIDINSTNFPDANFRSYLLSLYPKGFLNTTDINNCTSLNVSYKSISNLKGIEYFTALKELRCYNNSITSLDVSHNTNLTYLDCDANGMTSLDVSNTKLTYLDCGPNNLTTIMGVPNTLETLYCNSNNFTSFTLVSRSSLKTLDIRNCTSLKTLSCYSNGLTSLNVSGNTALTSLDCAPNYNLTSITGLADCTALQILYCYKTSISDLSAVNNFSNLTTLSCYETKITSLTLTNKSKLTSVKCYSNPQLTTANIIANSALTTLYINGCTALTELNCYGNNLTAFNVTGNTALKLLRCYQNNKLSTITGLGSCKALTLIDCDQCSFSTFDNALEELTNLQNLYARNNKFSSLVVTGLSSLKSLCLENNTLLTSLECYNNALTYLEIDGCTALGYLDCHENGSLSSISGLADCKSALAFFYTGSCNLSTLNLSSYSKLKRLDCMDNNLTSLNVTGCTAMQRLSCYNNANLASITGLANCTAITYLACSNCKITDLSAVQGMSSLETLDAGGNKLTSLTITGKSNLKRLNLENNTSLTTLNCYNNALTRLEIDGCTALTSLKCYQNSSLSYITGLADCKSKLTYLDCKNCSITDLSISSFTKLETVSCDNNKLTYLNVMNRTTLKSLSCHSNQLTTLIVQGCSALTDLDCHGNQLTVVHLQGCTSLSSVKCYKNQITEANMTTMIGQLPTRPSASKGKFYVLYYTGESNVFNNSHCWTAWNKNWIPYYYNGSSWFEIMATVLVGDVDGDSSVNISDVTTLIDYLLSGNASGINLTAADCDQDGSINISDVTTLIDYLLSGTWPN